MPFPRVASLAVFGLLLALPAQAQGTAASPGIVPGSAASAPSAGRSAAPTAERSAQSKACSMKADQQGLHGKARKAFRSACKHGRR